MHLRDVFTKHRTTFSFEFFPPKTEGAAAELFESLRALEPLKPTFVSVTYGAGGSTRQMTHELVERVKTETKLDPMAHLTGVGHTEQEIEAILMRYAKAGVSNILALRGDPPKGEVSGIRHQASGESRGQGEFAYAANLVKFIKGFNERNRGVHRDPRGFGIAVAGYPEGHPGTPNRLLEMEYLKAKVDAGADAIVTQLFFDNRDFLDFRDRCRLSGLKVPIVAGIMPITSIAGLKRILELAAGARAPAALLRALGRAEHNPESVRRVGVHWATEQCRDLLDHGVEGIHLYTLNKSTATREIYATLGVEDSLGMTV
ncbi:MAG: methylenetetrahydrofolate reductase [NAD(P)H] [Planctomycetes bacterium]|nr:methylenetetrahydrofolate reductase [NAD(P)H] [Planctomycetota bacterium]